MYSNRENLITLEKSKDSPAQRSSEMRSSRVVQSLRLKLKKKENLRTQGGEGRRQEERGGEGRERERQRQRDTGRTRDREQRTATRPSFQGLTAEVAEDRQNEARATLACGKTGHTCANIYNNTDIDNMR